MCTCLCVFARRVSICSVLRQHDAEIYQHVHLTLKSQLREYSTTARDDALILKVADGHSSLLSVELTDRERLALRSRILAKTLTRRLVQLFGRPSATTATGAAAGAMASSSASASASAAAAAAAAASSHAQSARATGGGGGGGGSDSGSGSAGAGVCFFSDY